MPESFVAPSSAVWLVDPHRDGKRLLPTVSAGPEQEEVLGCQAEIANDNQPLYPSDFSDDSIDIFTNFLCYGAGNEEHACLTTYCFLTTAQLHSRNMMNLDSIDQILGWTKSGPNSVGKAICTVSLLGGEFALHPDAKEIIKRIWIAGFNFRIVTNGSSQFRELLNDDDVVTMLRDESRNNLVAVSLDSITEEENDRNRGIGATKMALATIDTLNRSGREIPFRINATPLLNCVDGLPKLFRRAEELQAKAVIVHYPDSVGRGRSLVPGPQSRKITQQPRQRDWEKVLKDVFAFNQQIRLHSDFSVRCEPGFAAVDHCHMIERSSSLHFAPQISDDRGTFIPVAGCAFSMESIDSDSAYIMRDGMLSERRGSGQLETAKRRLGKTAFCPLYDGRACIYERGIY